MKKLLLIMLFLIGSVTVNAQFMNDYGSSYAIIPYGTIVNGPNFGVAIDLQYVGAYLDFGSEKIEKGIYGGDYMTFGLLVEPLPSMYVMAGLGSFEMYEKTQYFGYDFKLMYDLMPKHVGLVIAPMVGINSLNISLGLGVGLKLYDNKVF